MTRRYIITDKRTREVVWVGWAGSKDYARNQIWMPRSVGGVGDRRPNAFFHYDIEEVKHADLRLRSVPR